MNLELQNQSLGRSFKKIEDRSSFYFMYRDEDVRNVNNLGVPNSKQSVADFLRILLANTPLGFKQVNQRILITRNTPQNGPTQPENKNVDRKLSPEVNYASVTGLVTNGNGEPMGGVNVSLKGSSVGTSTNAAGKYSITVPPDGILVYSFIEIGRAHV